MHTMLSSFIKRDKLERADALVVLSGNGFERIDFATSLYKKGFAQKIVLAGTTGSRPAPELAKRAILTGVPEHALILELHSRNTKENAEYVLAIAQRECWTKIILVTSPQHQLRAYLTFKKSWLTHLEKIKIINHPPTSYGWLQMIESGRHQSLRVPRFYLLFDELYRVIKYRIKGDL